MIYLMTGQWSSTGQIIIFQYPSIVDEKNNGLTQRWAVIKIFRKSLGDTLYICFFPSLKGDGGKVDWGSPAKSSDPACNQIQRIYMKFS